jgi:hypothetical protein
MHIGYLWESQKESDHKEEHWSILKWILREIGWDGMDWIQLAKDRDQWRALVNMVMNLRAPKYCWEFSEWLHNWQLLRKGSAP